jgi:hypothetical protein
MSNGAAVMFLTGDATVSDRLDEITLRAIMARATVARKP